MISEIVAYVLQGAALVFITGLIYNADKHGFWMSRNPQTKETAQIVIAGVFLATGIGGGFILTAIEQFITGFSDLQLIGITIIISRVTVNTMITNWNHDDEKSIAVYAIATLLIAGPMLV
jgi:hypothetical protein